MSGWKESIAAAWRVCGLRLSSVLLLAMVAYNFSARHRRIRPAFARWLLSLVGAPRPVRIQLRRPRCAIWLRPFDAGDVQSFIEVFVSRCYPAPNGGIVVDAGANVGLFSVFALEEADPDEVVAIEPDADNVRLLRRNLLVYGRRCRIVEAAIWSREGRAFFLPAAQSNLGRLADPNDPWEARSPKAVPVRTVCPESADLPPPQTIDYLKLDVEGAEDTVLGHYLNRLPAGCRLVAELHGEALIERYRPKLSHHWRVIEEDPSRLVFSWLQ